MSDKKTKMSWEDLPDDRIVDLYWERNEDAIRATDDKYGKFLFAISYNILKNRLDGEECMNDTYLATWNRIPPARPSLTTDHLHPYVIISVKIKADISNVV